MAKGRIGGFLIHLIILIVIFLSLIKIVFGFHAKMLMGEFIVLLFFLLVALIAMTGKLVGSNWGNGGLFLLYGLNLVNFLFIYAADRSLMTGTIIVTIFGFLIAMVSYRISSNDDDDYDSDLEEIGPIEEEKAEVTTSFEPGKYVASKTGKKFHAPKCDWAKRIKKKSQVWFHDKDEAKKQKYKACDCVK